MNETIRRALVSGGVPAVLEPVGVCRNDGKRPDGMSLIPWSRGLPLLWVFTCSETLAPSNLSSSASGANRLANSAESAKCRKYSSLIPSFHFSPLCVESLGAWGSCARSLVRRIGSRVMEQSGDNRATQFLIQKVAIDVQRGNCFCNGNNTSIPGLGRVCLSTHCLSVYLYYHRLSIFKKNFFK